MRQNNLEINAPKNDEHNFCLFSQVRNAVKSFHAMLVERWNENMQPFKPLQNKMEALQQRASKGLSAEQNQNNRGQNKNCNGEISGSNKQNN